MLASLAVIARPRSTVAKIWCNVSTRQLVRQLVRQLIQQEERSVDAVPKQREVMSRTRTVISATTTVSCDAVSSVSMHSRSPLEPEQARALGPGDHCTPLQMAVVQHRTGLKLAGACMKWIVVRMMGMS